MIILNFYKGSANKETFALLVDAPLSSEQTRFVNSTDNVSSATIHIGNESYSLQMEPTKKFHHRKELDATEFSLKLTNQQMVNHEGINKACYVKLDNKRIPQEIEVHIN